MRGVPIICLSGLLQACAGLTSAPASNTNLEGGLIYFLPKKDIIIQVVVDTSNNTTATISTTNAYPDLGQAYVLRHQRSWVGTMDTKVSVGTNGLLATARAESTPKVSEVLQAFGKTAASVRAATLADGPPCPPGVHTLIIELPKQDTKPYCGFTVAVTKLGASADRETATSHEISDSPYTGVYYRQNEPYRVTLTSGGVSHMQQIVLSPSDAPRRSLPVSKTLFAKSTADFGFEDGSPNKFDQTTDSELLALLTIPADVIKAYFGAVGALFESFKQAQGSEVDALNAKLNLELASKKYDACIAAIKAGDAAQAALLGCGQ